MAAATTAKADFPKEPFVSSSRFFPDIRGDVASIFLSYFKRAPEFEALQHYASVYEALQADPATAGNAFNLLAAHIYADGVASHEVPAGPTITDGWYVDYLYGNILGRAPETTGRDYWIEQLETGTVTRPELVGTFIAAARATEGRDLWYVLNRAEVAVAFSLWENSNPQVLPTLKYDAAEVMLGVDENASTVYAALGRLELWSSPVGEVRNLTTGIDVLEGSTANDIFNVVYEGEGLPGASTLTNFDSLDGGLGTDTLNVYIGEWGANAGLPGTATIRNIEIVNVYNGGAAHDSLRTVSRYEGVEQFWQFDTAGDVHGIGEGVTVGFSGVEALHASVGLASGVASAAIRLDGVADPDRLFNLRVAGDALDAVAVDGVLMSDESALMLTLQAGEGVRELSLATAVETIVEVFRADDNEPRLHTLDMSGSTGGIDYLLDDEQASQLVGGDAALTITFGSGDDTFTPLRRALSLRDTIDGGEGYDTVVLASGGKLQTQNYDAIARLQNIEQLVFLGIDVEVDAAELIDFDLRFSGDGDVVIGNLAAGQAFTVGAPTFLRPDSVTLKAADSHVVMKLEEEGAIELRIDAAAVGGKNGLLTVSGKGAVLFDNATSGKFVEIDASGLEGNPMPYHLLAELITIEPVDPAAMAPIGLVLAQTELGIPTSSGMSGGVAETVLLSSDTLDLIMVNVGLNPDSDTPWVSTNSSTYGRMDVIENFNSDADAGPLDYLVGPGIIGKLSLTPAHDTLQLAFQSAAKAYAELAVSVLYFSFEGDTYLFADTVDGQSGQYDANDFALKIVGEHDIGALGLWVQPVTVA